ncbi:MULTISPECIES: DUF3613 domain-containing protein [unclassified Caballeronia]|uniref:DUF3613 domain-containing protein n=1 Tax=unclassified Caballeronia TaxID=2646786 RepID=UPI001F149FCD|nr:MULTISPECIES: DUF3613 domain-containing protein [unclassified Caballeronia]
MISQSAGLIAAVGLMAIATSSSAQTQTRLTAQPEEQAGEVPAVQVGQPDADTQVMQPVLQPVMQIGDAAHCMLALQRSGQLAAPALPMLGAEASAAYARYLKSFDHPIPEHLDSSVGTVGGALGGGALN